MALVVGIDIGGSTTKISGFDGNVMLKPTQIVASDPLASLFGAFGEFLYINDKQLTDIACVHLTGVGASKVEKPVHGLPTFKLDEFTANGLGGGYFAQGADDFIVISMGTGTSFVRVKNGTPMHLGGIGIGGGTLNGLCKYFIGTTDIDRIIEMAESGDITRVDLRVGDISKDPIPGLDMDTTASNFGKASSRANLEDKTRGIVHMVAEDVMQTGALLARNLGVKKIVLIGALSKLPDCKRLAASINKHMNSDVEFILSDFGEYGTSIGCALADVEKCTEIK